MWECWNVECGREYGNDGMAGMVEWLEWWNGAHANYLELLKKDRKNTSV